MAAFFGRVQRHRVEARRLEGGGGVATVELEREDVEFEEFEEFEEFPPRVGHLSADPARRIALCGAEILGVKAFEPYVVCCSCLTVRWWVWGQ